MQGSKAKVVEHLRAHITALEKRPLLYADPTAVTNSSAAGVLQTAPGLLHEVFTPERRNGGPLLGFALALARDFLSPERPAVLFVQLTKDSSELGLPFGGGLSAFGFDPHSLVLIRVRTIVEFLWAMEEAICCRAVAAVIGEVAIMPKLLDFTASRRLSLRAQAAGTSAFILRYGREREASASTFRWEVHPQESAETPFDPRAPGAARWRVQMEKGVLQGGLGQKDWFLGWTENGLVAIERGASAHNGAGPQTAPHGPVPATLADRLPQTA